MKKVIIALLVVVLLIPCCVMFTGCSLTPVESINGRDGENGLTPYIGTNGNWWIGNTDTGVLAVGRNGADGLIPYIGQNWNWWIGDTDTGKCAIGKDGQIPHIFNGNWWIGEEDTGFPAVGQNGQNGANGITPHIGENGNWWLGDMDTGSPAYGENGHSPYIIDGYWWINGHTTNVKAEAQDGLTPFIRDGTWWIGGTDTGISADVNVLYNEYAALLNYLIEMNKTIEYLQSLFTPAPASFDVDSWRTIANVSATGLAQNFYNVGDEKTVMLKDGEVITVVILGFYHDDLTSGLGKAGITLGMKNLMSTNAPMNAVTGNGWKNTDMRNVTLIDIFDRLPNDLQSVIKEVDKVSTIGGGSVGNESYDVEITADKLWLFSRTEIDGNTLDGLKDEGTQYEYWIDKTENIDRVKKQINGAGSAFAWVLRTSTVINGTSFHGVNPNGAFNTGVSSTGSMGISFGFCV